MFSDLGTFITPNWLYAILFGIYAISVIATICVIISENRSPVKSLAWLTVLILLPYVGIILYIFFGRSIKNTRMISRRNRRKLRKQETFKRVRLDQQGLTSESVQQIKLARNLTSSIYYPGNDVEIFTNGADKFDALLKDLQCATSSVCIQYYIFANDKIGNKVKQSLIDCAKRGVEVRLIYDNVGSFPLSKKYFGEMRAAGVKAFPFFHVTFPPFGTRVNWRNHRKICVIDGKIGYIGGMNVADRYIDGGKFDHWRDTHIRITGPAVGALLYSFAVDWNFMGQPLPTFEKLTAKSNVPVNRADNVGMQILTSGPTSQWTNIALLFIKSIANAKKRVYIQTPYFLPTEGLLRALQSAALSGVDVRLMIPKRSDSKMLDYATHSYMVECMQAGIKIYHYDKGMLHSKVIIVDDEFVSIGSTNFDFRSFEHNFEANMQIYSREVAKRMTDIFLADEKISHRIKLSDWKKRPLSKKTAESLLRLLSPVL